MRQYAENLQFVNDGPTEPNAIPHSIETEQAVLGAILVSNEILHSLADILDSKDFYDPVHQRLYEVASKLVQGGQRADPVTMGPYLNDIGPIAVGVTVTRYLGRLAASATSAHNAHGYARTIRDLAVRRALVDVGTWLVDTANKGAVDIEVEKQIEDATRRLAELSRTAASNAAMIPVSSFAEQPLPPRDWHVPGWMPANTVTSLGGDGGTGKSQIAAQLAVATVVGRPWLGLDVKRGGAIYLGAEDDLEEMHRRFAAIAREQGIGLGLLDDLQICCLAGKDAVLAAATDGDIVRPTPLWDQFRRTVLKERPAIVIYDTAADLFAGNENSRSQARQFINMLRGLSIESSSMALLLYHPSQSGMSSGSGTSGSTAWSNSVRARLFLDRVRESGVEPDTNARVLRSMKANYSQIGSEIRIRWHDGVFELSDNGGDDVSATVRKIKAESTFVELLETFSNSGIRVSAQPGINFAPRLFDEDARGKAIGRVELRAAMTRLLDAGRIRAVEYGPPSRRYAKLEVVRHAA